MAIMTGVQSAQILGPQYGAPVSTPVADTPESYKHTPSPSNRIRRSVVEPVSTKNSAAGSIIDIIQ